ncbi:MAG TPA: hypothetical protein V6D50_26995, partial [Chroococcales cyanobacterium]
KQLRATSNNETAVRSVACWWLTGQYTGCNIDPQAAYVARVLRFYQEARPQQSTPNASPDPSLHFDL